MAIMLKSVDRLFAELSDKIYSTLQIEPTFPHHNDNHIVSITAGLFDIEREYVLE